jgi:hypothetical protein
VPEGGVQEATNEPTIEGSRLSCCRVRHIGSRRVQPGHRDERPVHTRERSGREERRAARPRYGNPRAIG